MHLCLIACSLRRLRYLRSRYRLRRRPNEVDPSPDDIRVVHFPRRDGFFVVGVEDPRTGSGEKVEVGGYDL